MIQNGNKVTVHYTGKFEDGQVFDSSKEKAPISFVVGEKQVIPGFENAVTGLDKGDTVNVDIQPVDGYGEVKEELIVDIPADQVPGDVTIGANLQGTDANGAMINVTVRAINEDNTIKLDANHPLAGKILNFEIEVVDVE